MANNRVYIRCSCGKGGACLAKYYPSSGWFPPGPTPRGKSELDEIRDEERSHEYFSRIEEFFREHTHQDGDYGNTDFTLEYDITNPKE